jgi:NADH-quinone oxidoreductase subunit M
MLAHGFNTGALFLLVGMLYERSHTRRLAAFGGLASRMPVYTFFLGLFTFASIALPGTSGFVGEFLSILSAFQYEKWIAAIAFLVAILSAWYMLWMFQQVIKGRGFGELPDPHDAELTSEEEAMLDARGLSGEHGHHSLLPVSGGAHDDEGQLDSRGWTDLNNKELIALVPLAVLTIVLGVYPDLVFNIVEPSFERIMDPFMRGPLSG